MTIVMVGLRCGGHAGDGDLRVLLDLGLTTDGDTKTLTESIALTGWDATGRRLWTHRDSGTLTFGSNGLVQTHAPDLAGLA